MARFGLGKLALLLTVLGATGCHCCNDCEVTGYCCPEIKKEKVEIKGWNVECKQVCIPPIQCPCSDSCELKCGKVIAVRRLKKDKIECGEKCVVKYKLIDPCAKQESEKVEEKTKEPEPVEAPQPPSPAPMETPSKDSAPESPEGQTAAFTPLSHWATRRAEFQASHESY